MADNEVGGAGAVNAGGRKRVLLSVLAGTTLEWYDFFIYGLAAALIFNEAFFPDAEPAVGTLAAFATAGAGFIVRPLAAIVIGHLGDRFGRKPMLMFTVCLMGFSTIAIGVLPTYAAIGVWAPALLVGLRLLQGFAVGGEWGGAALMSVEHAPRHRRALYGSFAQVAVPVGYVLSSLAFLAVDGLPPDVMQTWGWRLPFLASVVVVAIAIYLRRSVAESPEFQRVRTAGPGRPRLPLMEVIRRYPGVVLLTIGATLATSTHSYIGKIYLLSYATQEAGVEIGPMLAINAIASGLGILLVPAAAIAADRFGWRKVFLCGAVGMALWVFPLFLLVNTGNLALITLAKIIAEVFGTAVYAPLAVILAHSFGIEVRYTGVSLGYQFAAILGGGFAPFIAAALFLSTGTWISVAVYYTAVVLTSIVAMAFLRPRQEPDLPGDRPPLHPDSSTSSANHQMTAPAASREGD